MCTNAMTSRMGVALGLLLSQASLVVLYGQRLCDSGDDALCLLPAIAMFVLVPWREWRSAIAPSAWRTLIPLLIGLSFATWMLRPLLATTALFLGLVWLSRGYPGWAGRVLLALAAVPSAPSVQFYLGYPLRLLTTEVSSWLLGIGGIPATAVGTLLRGSAGEVAVDAPCSGAHSLWVALVVVGAVSSLSQFSFWKTVRVGALALIAVLAANAVRAALLYPFLTGLWPTFPGYHSGVGLLCFSLWFWPWLSQTVRRRTASI